MASLIINEQQLRNEILEKLDPALRYVMSNVYMAAQKAITTNVYGVAKPEEYHRTFEFLHAWQYDVHTYQTGSIYRQNLSDTSSMYSTDVDIEGQYYYDPNIIHTMDRDMGQHVSIIDGTDIREALADIIFLGEAGHIFGTGYWTQRRNAMRELFSYVTVSKLKKWFSEGCQRAGIDIVHKGNITLYRR